MKARTWGSLSGSALRVKLLSDELTATEKEVLRMLGKGKDSKEIATRFDIARNTYYSWMWNIKTKLGASTDIQAVVMALVAGVID